MVQIRDGSRRGDKRWSYPGYSLKGDPARFAEGLDNRV